MQYYFEYALKGLLGVLELALINLGNQITVRFLASPLSFKYLKFYWTFNIVYQKFYLT